MAKVILLVAVDVDLLFRWQMMIRTGRFVVLFLLAGWGVSCMVHAEPLDGMGLRKRLNTILDEHPTARRTTVQLKVVDLQSGEVLFDRGGDRLLTPASNLKIYTSACALDTFGPEHCFSTRIGATGPIEHGELRGNLVLVGGGNAMLRSEELAELADRVKREWGVRRIAGQVLVDNRRYAPQLKGPGWMWDDEPDYYNMSITPLMLDFNVLRVRLSSRQDGKLSASLIPRSSYPPLRMLARADQTAGKQVTRRPFTDEILVLNRKVEEPKVVRLTMNDPTPWVAGVFRQMLIDRGVEVVQRERSEESSEKDWKITHDELVYAGATLAATLKHFNKVSENAVGEVLLHEIAIADGVKQPNWPDGAKRIVEWLVHTAGLEAGSFRLVDGSGLSRYNLISADSAIRLLAFMQKHEHFATFFDALPIFEVDLKDLRWPAAPAQGFDPVRVFAKTGGMSGVSTISGYVDTLDGRRLAFSLLANGFIGSKASVFDLRGRVWRALVQYRR